MSYVYNVGGQLVSYEKWIELMLSDEIKRFTGFNVNGYQYQFLGTAKEYGYTANDELDVLFYAYDDVTGQPVKIGNCMLGYCKYVEEYNKGNYDKHADYIIYQEMFGSYRIFIRKIAYAY